MKNTIMMTAALILGSGVAFAQKINQEAVPTQVKQAFSKKYPGLKAQWEKEGADYEAGFDLNKVETSAVFNSDGLFKESETEIKVSELPKPIADYCSKNFGEYKISEAAKITDAAGTVSYEAELAKCKEHCDALFDQQGNFIKKSAPSAKEGKD